MYLIFLFLHLFYSLVLYILQIIPEISSVLFQNVNLSLYRPFGFQEVEAPRLLDNRHMMVVRLSALGTGRLYPPGNTPGTHFCQRLSRPQGHSVAERIMTPSGIEPAILRLVAQCLNQLHYRHYPLLYHFNNVSLLLLFIVRRNFSTHTQTHTHNWQLIVFDYLINVHDTSGN
jgi:hypothetical protein